MNELNKRFKELRESLNLSQADFSKRMSLAQSTVAMIEVGKSPVRERHIKLLAAAFNVNEHWIRTGEGEMYDDLSNQLGAQLAEVYINGNNLIKQLIISLSKLDDTDLVLVESIIDRLSRK